MKKFVNVNIQKTFTQKDLKDFKSLNSEELNPERYDQKTISKKWPSMKFHGFDLMDIDAITQSGILGNTQEARASGNPEYAEIRKNILANGFDLSNFPISIRRLPEGKLVPMDGRTRNSILKELGMKNAIVAIYTCSDDDASKFAIWSNSEGYRPRGFAKMEDIYEECLRALDRKWIKNDMAIIKERIDSICSEIFTETKRSELTALVYNHYNQMNPSEEGTVVTKCQYWNNQSQIKTWLTLNKYLNTDKIIYFPISFSTVSKGIINSAKMAYDNPNHEIRVVVHTGVLTASDLEQCYKDRVITFKETWENSLAKLGFAFFDSIAPTKGRIKLYGAIPAVSTLHSLDKMIRFGYDDAHLYKKTNHVISKFIDEDEDELALF
jgi:hypothetical protein